jgi:hypothetical protein
MGLTYAREHAAQSGRVTDTPSVTIRPSGKFPPRNLRMWAKPVAVERYSYCPRKVIIALPAQSGAVRKSVISGMPIRQLKAKTLLLNEMGGDGFNLFSGLDLTLLSHCKTA